MSILLGRVNGIAGLQPAIPMIAMATMNAGQAMRQLALRPAV
jgi:hypothetical protein